MINDLVVLLLVQIQFLVYTAAFFSHFLSGPSIWEHRMVTTALFSCGKLDLDLHEALIQSFIKKNFMGLHSHR